MGDLHDALNAELENLPRLAARDLVRRKLADLNIDDEAVVERFADMLLADDGDDTGDGHIEFDWPEDIEISFDDADADRLQGAIDKLVEDLPDAIVRLAGKMSQDVARGIREQWDDTRSTVPDPTARTRTVIARDWGAAIDASRLLVTLCTQEGETFNDRHLRSQRGTIRDEARARLHIRACRIAEEIILLLEHGHAEGALARWRTLHEVAVVATLIKEGGDDLAERFFDHDAVEQKRMLDDYRRAALAAGEPSPPAAQAREIERSFDDMVTRYGKHFQGMYGWASEQLGLPKEPKFHDLQDAIGSLSLKHRFRVASSSNHASVATLGQPVHHWDPTTTIPGAFAAGFEGPAVDTAQAIVQATTALFDEPWDLDQLVLVGALGVLRDEIAKDWLATARRIEKREQRSIDRAVRFGHGRRTGYTKARPVGGWR